jgi:hypothetical protein
LAQWLKDSLFEIGLGILFAGVGTLRAIIHFAGEKPAAYYWLSAGFLVFKESDYRLLFSHFFSFKNNGVQKIKAISAHPWRFA